MDTLTRRRFLAASSVVGASALAASVTPRSWVDLVAAGIRDPRPDTDRILVLITLYGGNDGLSTVIPYADPAYRSARPDIAYDEADVLPLGQSLGLNPEMKGLHGLWKGKKLAIIRGVGYPKSDRSHFRSMDIWQTASPERPTHTGWVGRWLDTQQHDPLRAVSLGPVLPPLMAGSKGAGSAVAVGRLTIPGGEPLRPGLIGMSRPQAGEPPMQAAVAAAHADLLTVAGKLSGPVNAAADTSDDGGDEGAATQTGGQGALAQQLDIVARCIAAGAPTRVYAVSLGGFDLHAAGKTAQSPLLGELDKAMAGFLATVGEHPAGKSVVVAAYSEFGRRVAGNASNGTDHGTAGVMLVAGQPVRGGFYGEQPSLTQLDRGDLKVSVDFRSAYGELLEKVLDTEAGRVLSGPAAGQQLGFL